MKSESINDLVYEVKELSRDSEKNKEELDSLRKDIIDHVEIFNEIPLSRLIRKSKDLKYSEDERERYKRLIKEKKSIAKHSNTIIRIINKDYDTIYLKRMRNIRIMTGVIALSLVVGAFGIFNKKKDNDYKNNAYLEQNITTENTTEITTESTTMQAKSDKTEASTQNTTENTTVSTTEATTLNTTENTTQNTTAIPTETTTEAPTEATTVKFYDDYWGIDEERDAKIQKGIEIVGKFDEKMTNIEETISDPGKREQAKEDAKENAITLIDFIFYGKEMNGITFDELKDDQKQKVYSQLQKLDGIAMEYDPEYKEKYGENYGKIKDFGSLTLETAKEKIRKKVGDEYYESGGEAFDGGKEIIKETGGLVKKFISDKYQEWKNKQNEE